MRSTSSAADGKALRTIGFGFGTLTLAVTLLAAFLTITETFRGFPN